MIPRDNVYISYSWNEDASFVHYFVTHADSPEIENMSPRNSVSSKVIGWGHDHLLSPEAAFVYLIGMSVVDNFHSGQRQLDALLLAFSKIEGCEWATAMVLARAADRHSQRAA